MRNKNVNIAIIGLGYVGLPLAINFGNKYSVTAYDKNLSRINELNLKRDKNYEISKKEFTKSKYVNFTNKKNDLKNSNIFIITVPTPIKKNKTPDLSLLFSASKLVSKYIKKKDIIIYESTVYPGVTEEYCAPIIEKYSKLKFKTDFQLAYSPERINPGDKKYKLNNITKIVSASNKETLKFIHDLYKTIIKADIYKAESIKIAEAAKVIENSQRDINIAFMNEISLIFNKLNIDTHRVLKAAKTKWNFLNFEPGLVGGHCIGVDPFYLSYIAKKNNYNPQVILSGRTINDNMPKIISSKIVRQCKLNNFNLKNIKLLILGMTFKENCSDTRNSKVIELIEILSKKLNNIEVYDPWVRNYKFKNNKIKKISKIKTSYYDLIIYAVKHNIFLKNQKSKLNKFKKNNSLIIDLKNILPYNEKTIKF